MDPGPDEMPQCASQMNLYFFLESASNHIVSIKFSICNGLFISLPIIESAMTCTYPESFVRGSQTLKTFVFFFVFSLMMGGSIQIPLLAGQ